MNGWTDERVEVLVKLWQEGLSASEIAKQLGYVTRNGVIGKVHRLGLTGREAPSKPQHVTFKAPRPARAIPPPKPVLRIAGGGAVFEEAAARPPRVEIAPGQAFAPLPGLTPVSFFERTGRSCHWPVGGDGADMLCCGDSADPGPYCPAHTLASMPSGQSGAATRLDKRLGIARDTGRAR